MLRPTYRYVKTPCNLADIKTGDLFSMEPAAPEDTYVDPSEIYLAEGDPMPVPTEGEPANVQLQAVQLTTQEAWADFARHPLTVEDLVVIQEKVSAEILRLAHQGTT